MANNNEFIPKESLEQLEKLDKLVNQNAESFTKLLKSTTDVFKVIDHGAKDYKELIDAVNKLLELEKQTDKEAQNTKKNLTERERIQRQIIKAQSDEGKEIAKLRVQLQQQNQANKNLAKETNAASNSIEGQRLKVAKLKQEWSKAEIGSKQFKQLEKDLGRANKELTKMEGKAGIFGRNVGNYKSALGGITKLAAGFFSLNTAINVLKGATKTIVDFEQANANLATVLGKSQSEITGLTNSAKQLGATTEWMASQVTELQMELAKLGFDEQEITNMQSSVLQFATAMGANLADAASLAGSALRAFNLDSTETERVASVMTVGANRSALSFSYLETAMSTIAPVAKSYGFTIEDTVALLGTLSNAGFDASSAATATRNILLNLADSGGELAKSLGGPVKTIPELSAALVKLSESGIDLSEALKLTDKRSVSAFITLISGADSLTALREELDKTGGELERIQKERLDTVEGSVKLLNSAWEGLMLSFSESKGFMKTVVDGLTSIVNGIAKIPAWINENKGLLITLTTVIGAYTAAININQIALIKQQLALKASNLLFKTQRVVVLSAAAAKAVFTGNINRATAAWRVLNSTMKANVFIAIGTAIAGAAGAIYKLATSTTDADNAMKNFNKDAIQEQTELNNIFEAYKKANEGTKEKDRLLAIIKEKYGTYIQDLIDEKGALTNVEEAQKLANKALREQIALKMQNESINELTTKEVEKQVDILSKIRGYIAKEKGDTIANIVVEQIGEAFSQNMHDLRSGYTQAWNILKDNGFSPMLKKGIFSQSLGSDLSDLYNSFYRIKSGTKSIKDQFVGIINNANQVAGLLGSGEDVKSTGKDIQLTDDQQKALEKAQQEEFKAIQKAQENAFKVQAETNKRIFTDSKRSYEERLTALDSYLVNQENLLVQRADNEKELIIKKLTDTGLSREQAEKAVAEQIKLIDENLQTERTKITEDGEKDRLKIETDYAKKRVDNLQKEASDKQLKLSEKYYKDLADLANKYATGDVEKEDYSNEKLEKEIQFRKDEMQIEIDSLEEMLKITELSEEEKEEIQRKFGKAKIDYENYINQQAIADYELYKKTEIELDEKTKKRKLDILKETINAIKGFFDSYIKLQEKALEKQLELDNERFDSQLENIDEKMKSEVALIEESDESEEAIALRKLDREQQAEAQRKAIEDQRTQREKEAEEEREKLKKKEANMEMLVSLANLSVATLEGVFEIQKEAAVLASNPVTAPLSFMALAQIPLLLAKSGVAAAGVMAQRIAAYAEGTADHSGGLAVVGDGRRSEMIITPGGDIFKTPEVPTLVNLPLHTQVLPDWDKAIMSNMFVKGKEEKPAPIIIAENKKQLEMMKENNELTKFLVKATLTNNKSYFSNTNRTIKNSNV